MWCHTLGKGSPFAFGADGNYRLDEESWWRVGVYSNRMKYAYTEGDGLRLTSLTDQNAPSPTAVCSKIEFLAEPDSQRRFGDEGEAEAAVACFAVHEVFGRTDRSAWKQRRNGHRPFLAMSLDQYLQLLDWTGRELRSDKRGSIPRDFDPVFERLQCTSESWLDLVKNFRRRFRVEIGLPMTLQPVSSRRRANRAAART